MHDRRRALTRLRHGRAPLPPLAAPGRLTSAAAAGAALVTVTVLLVPDLRFAYEAPALHVALETAEAVVAFVVAYLVGGRFREHRGLQELLLTCGLAVLATANLVLSALPAAVLLSQDEELSRWAPLVARVLGTLLVAGAALAPADVTVGVGRVRPSLLGGFAFVLLLVLAAVTWGDALPPVVDPSVDLSDTGQVVVAGHPLVLTAQVLSGLLYAVAAVAFTRQAARTPDELLRWLGAGCALAAVARVDYVLFPSLYSDFVHLGDVLRLGFYLCMLVGAAREVRSYWARTAVLEDRRRLARDLHDGLTQELTYLYAQTQRLERHPDDRRALQQINGAAGRALDEARAAIGALTRPADEAFDETFQQSVEDLGRRYELRTAVQVERPVVVTPEQTEVLLRVTAEAVRNAARHGKAQGVSVALAADPLRLTVQDDGCGFHPEGIVTRGFGLTSMRERAEAVGAAYALTSRPGEGTRVEVRWP